MPLDYTHQHLSSSIVKAGNPHTPLDPNSGTDLSPLVFDGTTSTLSSLPSETAGGASLSLLAAGSEFSPGSGSINMETGEAPEDGNTGSINLFTGSAGGVAGAGITIYGAADGTPGEVAIQSAGTYGDEGDVLASNGVETSRYRKVLTTGTGAPGASLVSLLYLDTSGAGPGDLYAWDGSAYVLVAEGSA